MPVLIDHKLIIFNIFMCVIAILSPPLLNFYSLPSWYQSLSSSSLVEVQVMPDDLMKAPVGRFTSDLTKSCEIKHWYFPSSPVKRIDLNLTANATHMVYAY